MAFTQTQLDALQAALASGELSIRFSGPGGDRSVTYRSVDELKAAIAEVQASLMAAAGTRIRQHLIHTDKGF